MARPVYSTGLRRLTLLARLGGPVRDGALSTGRMDARAYVLARETS